MYSVFSQEFAFHQDLKLRLGVNSKAKFDEKGCAVWVGIVQSGFEDRVVKNKIREIQEYLNNTDEYYCRKDDANTLFIVEILYYYYITNNILF